MRSRLLTGGVIGTLIGVPIFGIIQTGITFQGTLSSWRTKVAIGTLPLQRASSRGTTIRRWGRGSKRRTRPDRNCVRQTMYSVSRFQQARKTREPFGVGGRRILWRVQLDPVDRLHSGGKQRRVYRREPGVREILKRNHHSTLSSPGRRRQGKAVSLAGLERQSTPALRHYFLRHVETGQPFVQKHGLEPGNRAPIVGMGDYVPHGGLLQILQRVECVRRGRAETVQIVQHTGGVRVSFVGIDGKTRRRGAERQRRRCRSRTGRRREGPASPCHRSRTQKGQSRHRRRRG